MKRAHTLMLLGILLLLAGCDGKGEFSPIPDPGDAPAPAPPLDNVPTPVPDPVDDPATEPKPDGIVWPAPYPNDLDPHPNAYGWTNYYGESMGMKRIPFVEAIVMDDYIVEGETISVTARVTAQRHPEILRFWNGPGFGMGQPGLRSGGYSIFPGNPHSPGYEIELYLGDFGSFDNTAQEEFGPIVDRYTYDFPALNPGDYSLVVHSAKARELGGVGVLYKTMGGTGPQPSEYVEQRVIPFTVHPASERALYLHAFARDDLAMSWLSPFVAQDIGGARSLEAGVYLIYKKAPGDEFATHREAITSFEVDYGDGQGWQNVTADAPRWASFLTWGDNVTHYFYAAPGTYTLRARATFHDGEVVEADRSVELQFAGN